MKKRKKDPLDEAREAIRGLATETKARLDAVGLRLDEVGRRSDADDRRLGLHIDAVDRRLGLRIDAIRRQLGEFVNGWGRFVEALVLPGIGPVMERRGYQVHGVVGPSKKRLGDKTQEVDAIALADHRSRRVVIAAEIRSRLDRRGVEEWSLELDRFFDFFPEYRDRELEGLVAGIRIDPGVERLATESGLFVLAPSGETVRLANPPRFRPRVWRARSRRGRA